MPSTTNIISAMLVGLLTLSCGASSDPSSLTSRPDSLSISWEPEFDRVPPEDIRSKKNLLFLSHGMSPKHLWLDEKIKADFDERGFSVSWKSSFSKLNLKDVSGTQYKYHVIVLHAMALGTLTDGDLKTAANTLQDFVKAGGGLLVTTSNYPGRDVPKWNQILAKFGKTQLKAEGICETDTSRLYENASLDPASKPGFEYSWTNAFNSSRFGGNGDMGPLPTGLYYFNNYVEPKSPATIYVETGSNWSHLVRSSVTGYAYKPTSGKHTLCRGMSEVTGIDKITGAAVTKNASGVDLISTREKIGMGEGRVAAWPMHIAVTLADGYSPLLEGGVVMNSDESGCKGCNTGTKASQGALLMYNLLDWLTIPSYHNGNAGFTNATVEELTPTGTGQPAFPWNRKDILAGPTPYRNSFRGFIGAQAKFNKTTMGTFVTNAQTAGYDFIVFTEDVNDPTINDPDPIVAESKWKDFVAKCDSLSGPSIQVFPGVRYKDYEGTEFVALGLRHWPVPLINNAAGTHPNVTIHNASGTKSSVVMLSEANRIAEPSDLLLSARLKAAVHGFALHVTDEGKTLVNWDDDTYLHLQKERHRLYPTVVHKTTNPADLVGQKLKQDYQAFIRAWLVEDALTSVAFPSSFRAGYVAMNEGPEILQLGVNNRGGADMSVPSRERIRLKVAAQSKNSLPLEAVEVFDNGRLYRRFLPGKEAASTSLWEKTIDDYHSHQHSFVLRAIDSAGRKSISWAQNTDVRQYFHYMQTDNLNTVYSGNDRDTGTLHLRHTELIHYPTRLPRMVGFPRVAPLHTAKNTQNPGLFATMSDCAIVSRFGSVCSYPLNYVFPAGHNPESGLKTKGQGKTARIPNDYYQGTFTRFSFARRSPGPRTYIFDYDITWKQNLKFNATPGLPLATSSQSKMDPGQLDSYALNSNGVKSQGALMAKKKIGPLDSGDDISIFPMLAAVSSMYDNAYYSFFSTTPGGAHLAVGAYEAGTSVKLDDSLKFRLASAHLPYAEGEYFGDLNPRSFDPQDIRTSSLEALDGWRNDLKRYDPQNPDGVLYLESDNPGPEFGVLRPFPQSDWPVPVMMSGLNPNWSAGVWYVGTGVHLRNKEPIAGKDYVVAEAKTDKMIYIGSFTQEHEMWTMGAERGTGFLQLDLTMGAREVFIGNFVTCSREDFRVTFHKECPTTIAPGATGATRCVEVHNPTHQDDVVDIAAHPYFTYFGPLEAKKLTVKAGQSKFLIFN
jgi:hypothetical protein